MRTKIILVLLAMILAGGIAGTTLWIVRRATGETDVAAQEARGDLRPAMLQRRAAAMKQPADPALRLRLAQTWLQLYDGAAAEKEFRAAQALGADPAATLDGLGQALAMQTRWAAILAEIPASGPTPAATAGLLLLRGTAQLELRDMAQAVATLAAARRRAPDQAATLMLAARVALAGNDMPQAAAAARAATDQAPGRIEPLLLRLRLETAANDPRALPTANEAVAAAPWSIEARMERAALHLAAARDADARADVDWVLQRYPGVAAARYLEATLLARQRRFADAAPAFQALGPAIDQFPRALYMHALVELALGHEATAADLAARYNNRAPDDRDGAMLLGRILIAQQRPQAAIPLLQKADPASADPGLLALLARAYAGLGSDAEAFRVRQQAAALAPGDPAALADLADSLRRRGEPAAALDLLERAARTAPSDAADDPLFDLAIETGDLPRAAAALARRSARNPEAETAGLMAAQLQAANGDARAAGSALQALAARYPGSANVKVAQAGVMRAQGRLPEAVQALQDVLAADPVHALALRLLYRIALQQNDLEPIQHAADAAAAHAPDQTPVIALRAEILLLSGQPRAAIATIDTARTGRLPPPLLRLRARAFARAGDDQAAAAAYQELLAAAPTDLEARLGEVEVLVRQGRADQARASLRAGLDLTPGLYGLLNPLVMLETRAAGLDAGLAAAAALHADPRNRPASALLAGDALLRAKQFPRAAAAFRAELASASSQVLALRLAQAEAAGAGPAAAASTLRAYTDAHPDAPEPAALRARLLIQARAWPDAQAALETSLRLRPDDPEALNNLAMLYHRAENPAALALAQRAYALAPTPEITDTLGTILLHQAPGEAADLLSTAARQVPANPAIQFHLAEALSARGDSAESLHILERLLARPGSFDDRAAAEQLRDRLARSR